MNDKEFDEFLKKHRLIDAMRKEMRQVHKHSRSKYVIRDLDDVLEDKLESTERYYIKQVAGMVAVHKILAPRTYVKDNKHLQDLIVDFMMGYNDGVLMRRLNPYKEFIDRVVEYMDINAGYLHIRKFMPTVPEGGGEEEKKGKKSKQQKSLDEIF